MDTLLPRPISHHPHPERQQKAALWTIASWTEKPHLQGVTTNIVRLYASPVHCSMRGSLFGGICMILSPPSVLPEEPSISLRPYQQECIARVITTYRQHPRGGRALIIIPTGGGKTIVFTEIARRLGVNTLIIAHRQELLQQAADKFRLVDPTAIIGQVGAGLHEWGAPITVASVQTISRPEHLKALKRFGYQLVVIDESHHACAEGYQLILEALPDAFVLGVTATPDRLDKKSIETIFGAPLFTATISDMVQHGYLCDLRAIAIRTSTSLDELHTQDGDFKTEELEEVVDTPERNERIVRAYLEHCQGRQAICFAVTVIHAEHLAEAFLAQGVRAGLVSGNTPIEERKRTLHAFELGQIDVMCNVSVLTEGYDCVQVSCIILARPTKSRALYVQAIGRGLRLAPGKRDCIILDITDACLKLRLQPQTLGKVLDQQLRDGESLAEAGKRALLEAEEQEQKERITKVTKRDQDLVVNVLDPMDWKRRPNGVYTLEIGEQKHKIILLPSEKTDGYYSVWAKFAPDFRMQQWLDDSPLEWAQMHAEVKARLLKSDEKKRILVDSAASWRIKPASIKQLQLLTSFGIPYKDDLTSGEASDLIGLALEEQKKQRAQKKAEKKGRTPAKKTPAKPKRARMSA